MVRQVPRPVGGVPSHDPFNAIFAALKSAEFKARLASWIAALQDALPGQVAAIDGQTLRRSFDNASGQGALHLVSTWADRQTRELATGRGRGQEQ